MKVDRFNEIQVGDKAVVQKTITAEDVDSFAKLSGDYNPLHIDEEYAVRAAFQQRVVHGMLSASLLSTLVGMEIPGRGALYLSQTLNFHAPVYPGVTLVARGEVTKKWEESRTLELSTRVETISGELIISGNAFVQVLKIKDSERNNEKERVAMDQKMLEGNAALVTGASRGIGREIALTLARNGADIWVNYRASQTAAKEVVVIIESYGRKAKTIKADVSNPDEVVDMIGRVASDKEMPPLKYLINNAGPPISSGFFDNWRWNDMEAAFYDIVGPVFHCTKAVLPLLIKNGGRIVNIITSAALGRTALTWLPYVTAKTAVIGLSKNLAQELGPKDIRVNMVSPSMTDTDLTSQIPDRYKKEAIGQTPLRKLASVEDVAGAVLFLVSPFSTFITGENILVTGGQIML